MHTLLNLTVVIGKTPLCFTLRKHAMSTPPAPKRLRLGKFDRAGRMAA
jgi:hypothetical protein